MIVRRQVLGDEINLNFVNNEMFAYMLFFKTSADSCLILFCIYLQLCIKNKITDGYILRILIILIE